MTQGKKVETLTVLLLEGVKVPRSVMQALEGSLTETGIEQWMRSKNRMLKGQTPLALLKKGECGRRKVIEAARAHSEGAHV